MFDMGKIIGKKVICIKGIRTDMRTSKKRITPEYILFDDGRTYITLEDQDCYTWHDYDNFAKLIEINVNENRWNTIINDDEHYPPATMDL